VHEYPLVPVAEDVFVMRGEHERSWTPAVFYSLADGSRYLHYGVRAQPRIQ